MGEGFTTTPAVTTGAGIEYVPVRAEGEIVTPRNTDGDGNVNVPVITAGFTVTEVPPLSS